MILTVLQVDEDSETNEIDVDMHPGVNTDSAIKILSGVMEAISTHPNVDPQALQFGLMKALTGGTD